MCPLQRGFFSVVSIIGGSAVLSLADAAAPEVHYATVEVFPTRGMRVTGEVSSVLVAQLTTTTAKTHKDERGWYEAFYTSVALAMHTVTCLYDETLVKHNKPCNGRYKSTGVLCSSDCVTPWSCKIACPTFFHFLVV